MKGFPKSELTQILISRDLKVNTRKNGVGCQFPLYASSSRPIFGSLHLVNNDVATIYFPDICSAKDPDNKHRKVLAIQTLPLTRNLVCSMTVHLWISTRNPSHQHFQQNPTGESKGIN
ncbi:hypothetical protein VNO77_33750 [Canavalia gladiata]|uniref:Uncharacterized protein n=1 Tax=Canavalia gladiata TaxID=3824 RepID=A0AAN9Q131_CANGL